MYTGLGGARPKAETVVDGDARALCAPDIALQVLCLRKAYAQTLALNGLDFSVLKGECFGLLGPNGAGKSTTMLLLAGVLKPDAGKVSLCGNLDPRCARARRKLGFAPQCLALYDELSAAENVRLFARLFALRGGHLKQSVRRALTMAGLLDKQDHRVATFSGGMKRRLNLACAIVHEPDVLLLDEPTVGVDPQSRSHLFDCIERLKADGLTIVYSTHYMEEATRLCDRIGIMDAGRMLAVDTLPNLVSTFRGQTVLHVELERFPEENLKFCAAFSQNRRGERELLVNGGTPLALLEKLMRFGVAIRQLKVIEPDLESVFLNLTGRSLRD